MSIWTNKEHRSAFDDAEALGHPPSGGKIKQWLGGVVIAAGPVVYGLICIERGHTTLFGRQHTFVEVRGAAGFWLAVAYLAVGAFLHFHYFWGLSVRLYRFSLWGKLLALLVFLPSFFYALWRFVGAGF